MCGAVSGADSDGVGDGVKGFMVQLVEWTVEWLVVRWSGGICGTVSGVDGGVDGGVVCGVVSGVEYGVVCCAMEWSVLRLMLLLVEWTVECLVLRWNDQGSVVWFVVTLVKIVDVVIGLVIGGMNDGVMKFHVTVVNANGLSENKI